jgi:uncharacterized protein involved in outer membrane biogenesis
MIETLGTILAALTAIVAVGAIIVVYVIWRSYRRMDDAVAEAAREAGQ